MAKYQVTCELTVEEQIWIEAETAEEAEGLAVETLRWRLDTDEDIEVIDVSLCEEDVNDAND